MTKTYTADELLNLPHRGGHDYHNRLSDILLPMVTDEFREKHCVIPYTGDLNLLREIEMSLTPEQKEKYIANLCELFSLNEYIEYPNRLDIPEDLFRIRTASVKDIAIALILTLQPKEGE